MQSLGYVEDKTLSLDARWGDGSDEALDRHAAELIRSKPHLLVSQTRAVFAIHRAATALPVVSR